MIVTRDELQKELEEAQRLRADLERNLAALVPALDLERDLLPPATVTQVVNRLAALGSKRAAIHAKLEACQFIESQLAAGLERLEATEKAAATKAREEALAAQGREALDALRQASSPVEQAAALHRLSKIRTAQGSVK